MSIYKITEFETVQTLHDNLLKQNQETYISMSKNFQYWEVKFNSQVSQIINYNVTRDKCNHIHFPLSSSNETQVKDIVNSLFDLIKDGFGSLPVLCGEQLIYLGQERVVCSLKCAEGIPFYQTNMNPYQIMTDFQKLQTALQGEYDIFLAWLRKKVSKEINVYIVPESTYFTYYFGIHQFKTMFPISDTYLPHMFVKDTINPNILICKLSHSQLGLIVRSISQTDKDLLVKQFLHIDDKSNICLSSQEFVAKIKVLYAELDVTYGTDNRIKKLDETFELVAPNIEMMKQDKSYALFVPTLKAKLIEFIRSGKYPRAAEHYLNIFGEKYE